jgi:LmbE family N-acetylglucosaminyl deacetylase
MTQDSPDHLSRRSLLERASLLGTSLALALPGAASAGSIATTAPSRLKVVVTGGHPGDPEYGCGGTVARYSDLGHDVVLLYLNKGLTAGAAQAGGAPDRVAEAAKACEMLKARPLYAGQIDGNAIVDRERYEQFHKLLEAERPDVVLTHWPIDNHADHRAISMLVYDAWLRMTKSFALYYYEVSNGEDTVQFTPTHYVDISAVAERKRAACYAHASQTPDRFYQLQAAVTRMRGIERGTAHAEGFIRHVQSPDFALPLIS